MLFHQMNKLIKIQLAIFLLIILITFTSASEIFKQSEIVDIKQSCYNNGTYCSSTASCNITITDPFSEIILSNQKMTNQLSYHNYTLSSANTSVTGEYIYRVVCNDITPLAQNFGTFTFMITPNGEEITSGRALFYIGIIIILIFFISALTYGLIKNDSPFMKVLMFGLIWLVLIAMSYTIWTTTVNFFPFNLFIGRFFYWIFIVILVLTFPMIIGSWGWYFWLLYKIKPIQEMLDNGVPEDRAYAGKIKGDLDKLRRGNL